MTRGRSFGNVRVSRPLVLWFGGVQEAALRADRAIRESSSAMASRLRRALCGVELISPNTACAAERAVASSAPTALEIAVTHSST